MVWRNHASRETLVKIGRLPMLSSEVLAQAVSEEQTFDDYTILYMSIAQGQGQITPGNKLLTVTKNIYNCNHTS